MSMIITLKTQLFRGDWDQARSQYALLWFMEAMCRVNQSHIRQFKNMADRGQGKPYPRLYKSGVHYERERGTEEWLDIPNILAGGSYPGEYPGAWDDCLPVTTLLMRDDLTMIPIGLIKPGMRIMGDGQWTTVVGRAYKGLKTILKFDLADGSVFKCSPEHRVFKQPRLHGGIETRAEEMREGDTLRSRRVRWNELGDVAFLEAAPENRVLLGEKILNSIGDGPVGTQIKKISELPCQEFCADIETDTGRFWLPESNLIVHNCEGVACWRVAELRELDWHWAAQARDRKTGKHFTAHIDSAYPPPPGARKVPGGIKAKPFAKFKKRDDGSYAYHALTLLPDGRLEDPSLTLGMTWERDFYDRDIARKYKDGELPVQIRYADLPDVVVIDPESPTGYSSNTERAKRNAGLASDLPSGNHVNGDNTCHECTNASPQEAAAWGYNRRDVRAKDMRELRTHVNDVGFRSGRLGRLGRVGAPEANWAARFLHQSNSISTPSIGSPLVKALRKRR